MVASRRSRRVAGAASVLALCAVGATATAAPAVGNWTVPRGRTVLVQRSLHVVASGTIDVAGTIEVAPGALLSLSADRLVVSGRIVPFQPRRRLARSAGVPVQIEPLHGSKSLSIDGLLMSAPGQSIAISTAPGGTIRIRGSVVTLGGLAGTAPDDDGGKAGSIILNAGPFDKAGQVVIAPGAEVKAGDGGAGYSQTEGRPDGTANPCGPSGPRHALVLRGSHGGDGGSIRIAAEKVVAEGTIAVGDGGNGGDAGSGGVSAPDGKPGEGGVDFVASSGDGGNGGSIVAPGTGLEERISAGRGGFGGDVTGSAGAGGANCDGGRTTAVVGGPGHNGSSGKEPDRQPSPGHLDLFAGGGDGGPAADREHPGGDGGSVRLELPRNHVATGISITDYADGGPGFGACTHPSTATAGGDGGPLSIGGRFANPLVVGSFDGGRGGSGDPPGLGGAGGRSSARGASASRSASRSFENGPPGRRCPSATETRPTTTTRPPTTTSTTSTAASGYVCTGNQITLFDNTNGRGVENGGPAPTFSTRGKAYCVTYIQTYHWNGGSGVPPGKLGLRKVSGDAALPATIGPLPAKASSGQDNAPNVNWYVDVSRTPPQVIDGTYACTDSSPTTWSFNSLSRGAGFCIVYAVPAVKRAAG